LKFTPEGFVSTGDCYGIYSKGNPDLIFKEDFEEWELDESELVDEWWYCVYSYERNINTSRIMRNRDDFFRMYQNQCVILKEHTITLPRDSYEV